LDKHALTDKIVAAIGSHNGNIEVRTRPLFQRPRPTIRKILRSHIQFYSFDGVRFQFVLNGPRESACELMLLRERSVMTCALLGHDAIDQNANPMQYVLKRIVVVLAKY
jgi:hypothetical protein